MNLNIVTAIFRRNLISYFSTPTGYVFICLFVFLCSAFAFWPNEFFNANLANLDQLNRWIAGILLIFIPAVTMSIWAEERRQGTDELLLTLPAGDLDVVLGKYLAASGIFSISLLFSMLCNISVLLLLADWQLDFTQFYSTYFGYWLMGQAMLAVGMVASFLTSNLTVAFILGVIFNVPLVIMQWAQDGWFSESVARWMRNWSYGGQFLDFGKGIFSLSGLVYFLGVIVTALYLCLIMIGKRHWSGGKDGESLGWHYFGRLVGLLLAVVGINALCGGQSLGRLDISQDQVNSLAPQTIEMIRNLDAKQPVKVEAFFSPKLPEAYQRQRLTIENFLREMEKHAGGKLRSRIVELEANTDAAYNAEQKYEITAREVTEREREAYENVEIFMGLAVTSGLNKQVVKFIEKDLPVEYELLRSIWAVNQPQRKKIGILKTDAEVLGGGFDFNTMRRQQSPFSSLVDELGRLYDVTEVEATTLRETLTESPDKKLPYDAIIAVQPSTLNPTSLKDFVQVVKSGAPVLIFEDPFPFPQLSEIPGTYAEKRPRGGSPFGMPPPAEPKGNIAELWDVLGVELEQYPDSFLRKVEQVAANSLRGNRGPLPPDQRDRSKILWSKYNPDKNFERLGLPKEFFWIAASDPTANNPFSLDSPVVAGMNQVLLPYAGSLVKKPEGKSSLRYLLRSGKAAGTVMLGTIQLTRGDDRMLEQWRQSTTDKEYIVAYQITGRPGESKFDANLPLADDGSPVKAVENAAEKSTGTEPGKSEAAAPPAEKPAKAAELNVILVADLDLLHSAFFLIRERKQDELRLDNDNVPLVLNMVDFIAGEKQFLEIRKRGPRIRPLVKIDELIKQNSDSVEAVEKEFQGKMQKQVEDIRKNINTELDKYEAELAKINIDENPGEYEEKERQLEIRRTTLVRDAEADIQAIQNGFKQEIEKRDRQLKQQISSHQQLYKIFATVLPPIPPLLVAFFVYFSRRSREKEGVNRNRLR